MGFNLLAFAGGVAKGITEEIYKAEEEAKTYATTSTKLMYDRYNKLTADNKELVAAATNDLDIIKANYTGKAAFNEQQLYQIGINPAVRAQLVKAATDKNIDLSTLSSEQIVKMVQDNTPGTARDRIAQAYAIPQMLEQKAQTPEKTFGGFMRSFGERAGETAAQKAAAALGVPLEQMRGAMQPQAKPVSTAEFDLSLLKPKKTFDQIKDAAQVAYFEAAKTGNTAKMNSVASDLAIIDSANKNLKPVQIDWAAKKSGLRLKALEGDEDAAKELDKMAAIEAKDRPVPARQDQNEWSEKKASLRMKALGGDKAAAKELDKMIAIEDRDRPKKEGDGEGKVPALGTLNSFVRDAGSRAVEIVHGRQLGKDLSRTQMPDGSVSLQYIGDNQEFAAQVENTRRAAALKALSLYPSSNRDVQSILKTYDTVAPVTTPPPSPVPTKPSLPAIPAKVAPTPPAGAKLNIGQERAVALDAIRQGANEAAVKKRFKDSTGQDL